MRLTILNAINIYFFTQNKNPNSPIFGFGERNMICMKDGRVRVYVLEEKVETDGI